MTTTAVILTYPAHFYQTCGTLASIRQHLPQIQNTVVVIDDISNLAWPSYVSDCQHQYTRAELIPASGIPGIADLRRWPYVRQQVIKLMLDLVIPSERWWFLDGDVTINGALPSGVFGSRLRYQGVSLDQRDPMPGEKSSQILFYIRYMLALDFRGFWDEEGLLITTSHPPVHEMRADVLRTLRHHIIERHHQNTVQSHLSIARDPRMSVCEWDLIECFRQQVMAEPADFNLDLARLIDTTWSSDRELGLKWFQSRDIDPDPVIWDQLPLAKYL
jgi:hypothetical protein